ncbi:outer membrane beta-barrel family protein [Flavobacterium oreochromis]|uniref:outer membrane beta-barrel family protein n=1 Tax=Flavobacterium oreochromis TaxID=2906078 RepID=UPI000B4CCD72|nr:outer membrane beta-barrel family protein [Flavobacterium oreochromis]OWP75579.1 TonB-dependent receptor [Flavobacterium oreochromis]
MKKILSIFFAFFTITFYSQEKLSTKKITITGKLIDKTTQQALEYATVTVINPSTNKPVNGAITDLKGEFSIQNAPGNFILKYEYLSFKTLLINPKFYNQDLNIGIISLEPDAKILNEVVVRSERTTVDLKLDKKVFTVGKDILVRGGTVSDVLDNIPSISVSSEGTIALRGNENVRILIDGKPTNAVSVTDALKMIPSDAIDKVETVTTPSARYDAEGGGGIINIILKKGKNQGINGSIIAAVGTPKNNSISANINYKNEMMNFFSTIGYNDRNNPGRTKIDQETFNKRTGLLDSYLEERRESEKYSKGINVNFGIEIAINKNTSWTNSFNYRNNKGGNNEDVFYYNFNANKTYLNTSKRDNELVSTGDNVEYTTNFTKKFKKEGHKLTFDGAFSKNTDKDDSDILQTILDNNQFVRNERSKKHDTQVRNLLQIDYIIPFNKDSQFEAGYRGNFINLLADFSVQNLNTKTGIFENIVGFSNQMNYIENVNALYTQFGSKINKLSYLLGLRFENSHIEINQLTSEILKSKNYNNFFPSIFLTYELGENTSISSNYSKRITRPRDRFINPFASYTSNINLFQGNPDINPAYSDAFDIGFLKKWNKLILNTSVYLNHTTDSFQIIRKERGDFIDGTPVIINTPFNLSTDDKYGFEITANYTVKKWWKLNANANFFYNITKGDYQYTNTKNELIVQDFNFESSTWTGRINSRINLPYKIDFQSNLTYNASQKIAQGTQKGIAVLNLGFSKDILKDKATLAFNISDVFNSRKMIRDLNLPTVNSYSEMQNRMRVATLSFTYRFNKSKTEKEKDAKPKSANDGNDNDYIGG